MWRSVHLSAIIGVLVLVTPASSLPAQKMERQGDAWVIRGGDSTPAFRFDWPAPCTVEVNEKTVKRGHTVNLRYTVSVKRAPKGPNLEIRCVNYKILEVDGRDLRRVPTPRYAALSAIPDIEVAPDGRFVRFLDFDRLLNRALAAARASRVPPDRMKKLQAMLASPEVRAMMEENAIQFWRAWVEVWIGSRLKPGESREERTELPLPGGSRMTAPVTYRNHGPVSPDSEWVRLTMQTAASGADAKRAVARGLRQMLATAPDPPDFPITEDLIEKLEVESRITAVTRPDSLRPRSVTVSRSIRIRFAKRLGGRRDRHQTERREFEFFWPEPID